MIVSDAVCTPFRVAVITTVVTLATPTVVTVNGADEVWPPGTSTDVGTWAAPEPELRLTDMPPVGAALLMVTVPADVYVPLTVVGFRLSPVTL